MSIETARVCMVRATLVLALLILMNRQVFAQEDWFEKGLLLTRAQRYHEAIQAFSNAIELIPEDFQAYNYRGVARIYQGDYAGAIADYTVALQIKTDYADAFNNRGFARLRQGDPAQALKDFSRAIEIDPALLDAYNSKAWILATSSQAAYRNPKEAVLLAKKAVEIRADIDSLDTLAAAYAADGQFPEAIATQKRVIHMLVQQESTERLKPFLDHLHAYKDGQPLRIDYAAAGRRAGTNKFEKPLPEAADPGSLAAEASQKASAVAGPYPYTIQVSAYRDQAKSVQVAASLLGKGDPAFACPIEIPGKGNWHRVFVGWYRTLTEARSAAAELKKRKFEYVQVTRKPYAVQVGLFGSTRDADEAGARLREKGYITYRLHANDRSGNIRLLIGAYEDRENAGRLADQLSSDGIPARVLPR